MIHANDTNFEHLLNDPKTIIVDFWSPTCVPCRQIEPSLSKLKYSFRKIARTYKNQAKVVKVNVNESPKTSSRYYVRGLPTLIFIKDGSVKTQITGAVNPNQIEQTLQKVI